MIKLLVKIPYFKRKIMDYAFKEKSKPKGFETLSLVFKDTEGRGWYTFNGEFDLYIQRRAMIDSKLIELSSGLTGDEIEKIAEAQIKAINNGTKPDLAMVGHLAMELKNRKNMIVHKEIIYDLLALCYIRSDENPATVDAQIHNEKVAYLLEDGSVGFFFENQTFKELLPWAESIKSSFEQLLTDSGVEIAALRKQVEAYTSG